MPAINPLLDSIGGAAPPPVAQHPHPGARTVNPNSAGPSDMNASGTSENLAMHVAALAAFAIIGIYVLRASGFRFVVAAGVGGIR